MTARFSIARIRWQDWLNVGLGTWLLVSPYVMGYSLNKTATGNACGLGVAIAAFNVMAACRSQDRGEELLNILMGLWLVLSPLSLGFFDETRVALNAAAVGVVLMALSVWQIIDTVTAKTGR